MTESEFMEIFNVILTLKFRSQDNFEKAMAAFYILLNESRTKALLKIKTELNEIVQQGKEILSDNEIEDKSYSYSLEELANTLPGWAIDYLDTDDKDELIRSLSKFL